MPTMIDKQGKLAICVRVSFDNFNAHYISFVHLYQCTNKPMPTAVHTYEFIYSSCHEITVNWISGASLIIWGMFVVG
jgi:hypothetical protein